MLHLLSLLPYVMRSSSRSTLESTCNRGRGARSRSRRCCCPPYLAIITLRKCKRELPGFWRTGRRQRPITGCCRVLSSARDFAERSDLFLAGGDTVFGSSAPAGVVPALFTVPRCGAIIEMVKRAVSAYGDGIRTRANPAYMPPLPIKGLPTVERDVEE